MRFPARLPEPASRRWIPRLAILAALLAYGAALDGLAPRALSFDGMAFLLGARGEGIDYGHALYLPLLRLALAARVGVPAPERSGRLVSAIGAVLAVWLLWRHLARRGSPALLAGLVTALLGLAALFWHEAGSVEPTTWTLVALLGAGAAAEGYARRPGWTRLAAVALGLGAALGFHLVSVCAVPWLVWLATRGAGARPRAHALVPLIGFGLAIAGLLGLARTGGALGVHWAYWLGFLPDFGDGVGETLLHHVRRGGRLLAGAPVLGLASVVALVVSRRRPGSVPWEGVLLGGPYLLAFLVLGKPLAGLLFPVLLSAALVVATAVAAICGDLGARTPAAAGPRRALAWSLGLAAALQLGLSLPHAWRWRNEPDVERKRAELLAEHLPEGVLLLAGSLSNHLRYYRPALEIVSLPEVWHRARADSRSADPIEVVRGVVASSGRRCALSSDGVAFLYGLGADPERLGITVEGALWIPGEPELALFPLSE